MNENRTEDVVEMVKTVLNDYENDRDIDQINIYNKPDKEEVRELVRGYELTLRRVDAEMILVD